MTKDNIALTLSTEELKRFGNAIGISDFDILDEATTRYQLKKHLPGLTSHKPDIAADGNEAQLTDLMTIVRCFSPESIVQIIYYTMDKNEIAAFASTFIHLIDGTCRVK